MQKGNSLHAKCLRHSKIIIVAHNVTKNRSKSRQLDGTALEKSNQKYYTIRSSYWMHWHPCQECKWIKFKMVWPTGEDRTGHQTTDAESAMQRIPWSTCEDEMSQNENLIRRVTSSWLKMQLAPQRCIISFIFSVIARQTFFYFGLILEVHSSVQSRDFEVNSVPIKSQLFS